jgi:hypothetical protein
MNFLDKFLSGKQDSPVTKQDALQALGLDDSYLPHLARLEKVLRDEKTREIIGTIYSASRKGELPQAIPGEYDYLFTDDDIPDMTTISSFLAGVTRQHKEISKIKKNSWKFKTPQSLLEDAYRKMDSMYHRGVVVPSDCYAIIRLMFYAVHNNIMGMKIRNSSRKSNLKKIA